jgi:hypothetical protein
MLDNEDDLKDILVTQPELVEPAEFGKARAMAARLKIPLDRAVSEHCAIPPRLPPAPARPGVGRGFR